MQWACYFSEADGLQMTHCLVYIDDVIVVGRSFEEHLCNIRDVFNRVRGAGLKLKPSKCMCVLHAERKCSTSDMKFRGRE